MDRPQATPVPPSNENNGLSTEAVVPTVLLILVLLVNIIVVVVFLILWMRKRRKEKRKRENFIVKMSDLTDEFAEEIVYVPEEDLEVGSRVLYVNYEMIQEWRNGNGRVKAFIVNKPQTHHQLSTKATETSLDTDNREPQPHQCTTVSAETSLTINSDYDDIKSSPQANGQSERVVSDRQESSKLRIHRQKVRQKTRSKKKQGQPPFADASVSIDFASNNAYNCEDEPMPANNPQPEHDGPPLALNVQPQSPLAGGSVNMGLNNAYNCEVEPTPMAHGGPPVTYYVNQRSPNRDLGPQYSYIDHGATGVESTENLGNEGPNYTYIDHGSTQGVQSVENMGEGPNYTYIDNETNNDSKPEYTYIEPEGVTSSKTDSGNEYTYIDQQEPPHYSSVGEQSTEYYADVQWS